jgi:hypothetical protein
MKMLISCLENETGELERTLLRGMENLRMGKSKTRSDTVPVTLDTLHIIKKGLSGFKEKLTGQTIWTCCLVAFWGAFRLGELLGKSELKFDRFSDLLWENVVMEGDTAIIHVKSPKTRGTRGVLATLFEIPDEGLCPVRALRRLKASQGNLGLGEPHLPVFRKSCGKFLTKGSFLDQINRVLERHSIGLTGKSFRTGLPSALENFPQIFQESHLKALGRWKGRSYQLYMKNDTPEFRWVFRLVATTILNRNNVQGKQNGGPATSTGSWRVPMGKSPPTRKTIPIRTKTKTRGKKNARLGGN